MRSKVSASCRCAPHVFVQHLTVRAALEGDRNSVYRAAVLDRPAASVLTLSQIRAMTDELTQAHGNAMPEGIRARTLKQAAE